MGPQRIYGPPHSWHRNIAELDAQASRHSRSGFAYFFQFVNVEYLDLFWGKVFGFFVHASQEILQAFFATWIPALQHPAAVCTLFRELICLDGLLLLVKLESSMAVFRAWQGLHAPWPFAMPKRALGFDRDEIRSVATLRLPCLKALTCHRTVPIHQKREPGRFCLLFLSVSRYPLLSAEQHVVRRAIRRIAVLFC